jgi:hypothetical protein
MIMLMIMMVSLVMAVVMGMTETVKGVVVM